MTTPNQPGWYDDPQDPNAQRYSDGQDWTPHRQRKAVSYAPQQSPPSARAEPPGSYSKAATPAATPAPADRGADPTGSCSKSATPAAAAAR